MGAGVSGIAMAVALRRAGHEQFTIYERAADVGGVWQQNTYPGAACDVPSYLYSFSFRQRRDWSRPCSPQAEIRDYLHETIIEHGLSDHLRTGVEVVEASFDERSLRWLLHTDAGAEHSVDVLVVAVGQLSRPAWPAIAGQDRFTGRMFHSARWDHDFDPTGKRVAVIGTGASAVQFVPTLAAQAGHLDVYQRSAPYLLPRRNHPYGTRTRAWVAGLPGLQALRRVGMTLLMEIGIEGLTTAPPIRWLLRAWSALFMRGQVSDPELRRKARPDHPFGCKRILFSSYYLPALARPDVELVVEPIEEITEDGVVSADGVRRPADCIIFGTGFKANEFVTPMRVRGVGGRDLQQQWRDGAHAHLGISVAGFPNMFLLYGPNTNLGIGSVIVMIEAQATFVVDALRTLRRRGGALDVRTDVSRRSDARTQARLRRSVWTGCQSWYRTAAGRVTNNWPGTMREYVAATRSVDLREYRLLSLGRADTDTGPHEAPPDAQAHG